MQKAASSTLQAITANRLDDGLVVFLAAGGRWVEAVHAAEAYEGAAVEAALAVALAAETDRIVLGPYAIDVAVGPAGIEPTRLRERIRAFGPTAGSDTVAAPAGASRAA